jgi:hypothetical protein
MKPGASTLAREGPFDMADIPSAYSGHRKRNAASVSGFDISPADQGYPDAEEGEGRRFGDIVVDLQ